MSDSEQEWKPSGRARPQSTIAQAFSTALDSAFMLDSEVDHLAQSIDQKKYQMMIQNRELEALQNRIREAEARLKKRQSVSFGPSGDSAPPTKEESQVGEEAEGTAAGQEEANHSEQQQQQQQEQEHEQEQKEDDS